MNWSHFGCMAKPLVNTADDCPSLCTPAIACVFEFPGVQLHLQVGSAFLGAVLGGHDAATQALRDSAQPGLCYCSGPLPLELSTSGCQLFIVKRKWAERSSQLVAYADPGVSLKRTPSSNAPRA